MVILCALALKLDADLLRRKSRQRIVLLAALAGLFVYVSLVFPIESYGFHYGRAPLLQKHMLVLGLCLVYGAAIFLKHTGEFNLYQKFKRKWAVNLVKIITFSIFFYLAYAVFCLAGLILTWPYYKGVTPWTFFLTITFRLPGIVLAGIFGVTTGLIYWLIASRIRKAQELAAAKGA